MKLSEKIYLLYRKARDLESEIRDLEDDISELKEGTKIADNLGDILFKCVGQTAAYEIDDEYFAKQ